VGAVSKASAPTGAPAVAERVALMEQAAFRERERPVRAASVAAAKPVGAVA
jgi:hypothetical protein